MLLPGGSGREAELTVFATKATARPSAVPRGFQCSHVSSLTCHLMEWLTSGYYPRLALALARWLDRH
jgi:hypothetical protein